jgi:sulfur carrier protein ThiS
MKEKYETIQVIDIIGQLDVEDDQVVVRVDGYPYPLSEIVESMMGYTVQIKCQK